MTKKLLPEIVCVAELTAKEGMVDILLENLLALVPLSKSEPGCLRYELHQNLENTNMLTFIDRFKDQDAFDQHCEASYIKKYFDEIIPGLTDDIKISIYREINTAT